MVTPSKIVFLLVDSQLDDSKMYIILIIISRSRINIKYKYQYF
jgi:hypothetical protein